MGIYRCCTADSLLDTVKGDSPLTFSAQYGSTRTNKASVDEIFTLMGHTEYLGDSRGYSQLVEGAFGYSFHRGESSIVSAIGYRQSQFLSGAKQTITTEENYLQKVEHLFGLEVEGMFLSLQLDNPISDSLTYTLRGAFSPALTFSELRYEYLGETSAVPGDKIIIDQRFPHDQQSIGYELGIGLDWQASDHLTVTTGYHYEFAAAQYDLINEYQVHGFCMADHWEYRLGQYFLQARYSF